MCCKKGDYARSQLPEEDLNKEERAEYAHISEYMRIYLMQNNYAGSQLPEVWKRVLRKVWTIYIKESHNAINLWRDKVAILKARGQHHGVATLQCQGQLAEQLAGSLAFLGALAPGQELISRPPI